MKTKILRFIATTLAVILLTGVVVPADSVMSLSVQASATSGTDGKTERANEGKKNISDDVDYWNDINIDRSFAYQIRMATNYHIRQAGVGNTLGSASELKFNNVAPFFGYTEGEIETDVLNSQELGALMTKNSNSSGTYTRASFYEFNNISGSLSVANQYYQYGLLLNLIGFDSTGTAATDVTRQTYGTIALLSYKAASFVNVLFDKTFDFLIATNPFQFFKDIATLSSEGSSQLSAIASDAADARDDGAAGAFATLGAYFSNIFNVFTNFAWTISIPLSFVFIIITFFLTRRGRYSFGTKLKQFLVRVVFVAIGIPILGSAYTQVLYALKDTSTQSDDFITQSVAYTFLDFGKWVETSRLDPSGVDFRVITSKASSDDTYASVTGSVVPAKTWANLRKYCYDLNIKNGVFDSTGNTVLTLNTDSGLLLKDFVYDTTSATLASDTTSNTSYDADYYNNKQSIDTVLKKYRDGTKYSAINFESGSVAWMQQQGNHYGDMLALSCDKYSFSQNAERQVHGLQTGKTGFYDPATPEQAKPYSEVEAARFGTTDFAAVGYNIWNNGGAIAAQFDMSGGQSGYSGAVPMGIQYSGSAAAGSNGYNAKKSVGLSTMATYVYLTSEFSQTGVNVYGEAPSVYTQVEHYAVNLIGGDFVMQTAFFVNMVAIQLGYFCMALVFVFKAAFDILFKGFQVMGHALMGALGMYKSIGTCICMVINMIVQLFVCVIFFTFMTDLMFGITSIVDYFLTSIVGAIGSILGDASGYNLTNAYHGELVVTVSSFLSAFIIVFFVSFASKWRSLILTTINGFVEQLVGALLGTQMSGASDGVMGNMAKAALGDAKNVAGFAAAAGVGIGAADAITDKVQDLSTQMDAAEEDIKNVEGTSAIDGAVNATDNNPDFDGGKGQIEGDVEVGAAEGEEILANGLGDKEPPAFTDEELADMKDPTKDNNSDIQNNSAFNGYHFGGTAEQQEAERAKLEEQGVTFDADGNAVLSRTDADADAKTDDGTTNDSPDTTTDNSTVDDDSSDVGLFVGPLTREQHESQFDKIMNNAPRDAENGTGASGTTTDSTSGIQSEVTEDEDGTLWTQYNASTGEKSGFRFDPERGLVMSTVDENGNVSDVAIGANGISMATTDENGNKTVTEIGENGMTTTYTGEDGTVETSETSFDGTSSATTVTRTNPDGTVETVTSGVDGTVTSRVETTDNGIRKETVMDDDGNLKITETNADTGYSSVTSYDADGNSSQTETINGITTTTDRNVAGEVTSQTTTSYDVNGNPTTTSYVRNADGSYAESTTANGVTNSSVYDASGNRTDVQSVMRADGTTVETTTSYGNDDVADSTKTVLKSARGDVIYTGNVTTGNDSTGDYTLSSMQGANGNTIEVKDYGNGHVITTETNAEGDTTVTTANAGGGYSILETDAQTGTTYETTLDSGGSGQRIVKNASGATVETTSIAPDTNGVSTYETLTGGSLTFTSVGEGKEAENVVAHTYAGGGSRIVSTNAANGDMSVNVTDGHGSSSTTTFDKSSGNVTTEFVNLTGNSGSTTLESDGDYKQVVNLVGGGSIETITEGEGADAVTTINKTDAQGNYHSVRSQGGQIIYSEQRGIDGSSSIQSLDNGVVTITSTAANGDVTEKVIEADGDFKQTTTYSTGAKYVAESEGGKVTAKHISATGIVTDAVYDGSTADISTQYAGFSVNSMYEGSTGNNQVMFKTSSGQTLSFDNNAAGDKKIIIENPATQDYMAYTNAANGQNAMFIRNGNGSGLTGVMGTNGQMQYVYTDASGNVVEAPTGADTLNVAYADAMNGFNASMMNGNVPAGTIPVMTIPVANPLVRNDIGGQTGLNLGQGMVDLEADSTYSGSARYASLVGTMGLASAGVTTGASIHRNQKNYLQNLFDTVTGGDDSSTDDTNTTDTNPPSERTEGGQWGENPTDSGGSTTGTD